MSSRPIRGAARLAAILDALPDALLLVNSNGTVVEANTAAVQALQAPGTSLVGMGVLDLLPEFDPSRIPGSMRPAPRGAEGMDHPVRMTARRTDGSTFAVEVCGNDFADDSFPPSSYDPYRDSGRSGEELLLLLVRDLSGRLGVEAELRRQHKQTEMILRAAAEGVLGVDLDGRVVLVNPAAAHILDYRASELGGRELHPLIQHSQADGSPLTPEGSALLDTLTSGRKHRVRGTVLWRKDGTAITVDLTTAPVRDGDQLVGAVMTFTDRTRELVLTARIEHLTAVLESELGTALDVLHGRIDALAGDPAGQLWPEANWMLRRLADECHRFGRLIDGVLEHQRFETGLESGKPAPDREPVALDEIVQAAVERAGELVGPGRVRYSVHAAAIEIPADRDRLAQALAHLVADVSGILPSLQAPGSGAPALGGVPALPPVGGDAPMVVLAAAQRGDHVRIEVRGPAHGNSPVHLPIARSTVERHGGVLQRHQLPSRAGTTYVMELPLDPAARPLPTQPRVPQETDTAMLPEMPEMPPNPSPAPDASPEPGTGGTAGTTATTGSPGSADGHAETTDGPAGTIVLGPVVPAEGGAEPNRPVRRRRGTPAAEEPAEQTGAVDGEAMTAGAGRRRGLPGPGEEPVGESAPAEGGARRRRGGSAADEPADPSNAGGTVPAGGEPPGGFRLPDGTDPFVAVYPGLEHALPSATPAVPAVPATGRRRRLGLPGTDAHSTDAHSTDVRSLDVHSADLKPGGGPEPAAEPAPAHPGSAGLPALPALPGSQEEQPQPVGSGLGRLTPPRSFGGFTAASPHTFPDAPSDGEAGAETKAEAAPAPVRVPAPARRPALPALAAAPRAVPAVEPRSRPRPLSELVGTGSAEAPAGQSEQAGGVRADGSRPAVERPTAEPGPAVLTPAVDGGPRRLLVWPEPDPSTKQALQERGYRTVIVRSREEVDAQVAAHPAALFVDPLTGPITRTALQSLRTAALQRRVPVLVTAGLGQANRDAAYGADPAILLRALAPRDSDNHAPRVLLVESDQDIASALISGLERRGMHVEHAADENDAVSRASSVQPNLVVMDLLQIRHRRVGLLDWLHANDRLHRTPLVVYTSVDLDPRELPRLRTGETVLFLAERSTSDEVQARIVDLLGRIGAMGETIPAGQA